MQHTAPLSRLLLLFGLAFALHAAAQPPARLREAGNSASSVAASATDNAARSVAQPAAGKVLGSIREFPTAATMPQDAAWRRDIYREIDLTRDANAPLYYPVTPGAGRENLFVCLFHLILRGKINAYEYTPDAIEHFDEKHIVKGKKIMDDNHIFYETNDGKMRVNDADLPSEDVKRYYIKESVYFNQHTGTFSTQVEALCPLMVSGDFGDGSSQTTPLFWVKYDEAAPYLAKLSLMSSNLNNAAEISADDFFNTNRYEGPIYQTKNLQDRTLAQIAPTDSARTKVREQIEAEIRTFQRNVWMGDSVKTRNVADTSKVESPDSEHRKVASRNVAPEKLKKQKAPKPQTSSPRSSATLSVRRQRH